MRRTRYQKLSSNRRRRLNRIAVASFLSCFVLSPLYKSSLGFGCLFTDHNRNRAQRLLARRMNLCRGRRFLLLLLQQTPSKEKLESFQEVALAPVGGRGLPYIIQLSNRLENFLYRWCHKGFHPMVGKSPLQFVHFLGSPGSMDTQTDDTRSHFI